MGIYLFRAACPASKQPSGPRSIEKFGEGAGLFFTVTEDSLNPSKPDRDAGLFKPPEETA